MEAGYIGKRGLRLFRAYDVNQINADPILPQFITMQQNVAKGCRAGDHALQLTARKRYQAGLLLGFAYTWSKSIDDQSVDPVGSSSGGGLSTTNSRTPADTRNWRNERAFPTLIALIRSLRAVSTNSRSARIGCS